MEMNAPIKAVWSDWSSKQNFLTFPDELLNYSGNVLSVEWESNKDGSATDWRNCSTSISCWPRPVPSTVAMLAPLKSNKGHTQRYFSFFWRQQLLCDVNRVLRDRRKSVGLLIFPSNDFFYEIESKSSWLALPLSRWRCAVACTFPLTWGPLWRNLSSNEHHERADAKTEIKLEKEANLRHWNNRHDSHWIVMAWSHDGAYKSRVASTPPQ